LERGLSDHDCSARDRLESGNHPQRGRLAATRCAYQDHELAVLDVEAAVLGRRERQPCTIIGVGLTEFFILTEPVLIAFHSY